MFLKKKLNLIFNLCFLSLRPIGDDDDDSSSVTMDSSSPAPDTIPVLHLKATEGAPGEFDNQTASCGSTDGMDLDQLDSSYERMMTDADLALNQPENEPHPQARSVEH